MGKLITWGTILFLLCGFIYYRGTYILHASSDVTYGMIQIAFVIIVLLFLFVEFGSKLLD